MTITAFTGPLVTFADPNNPETGPSLFIQGSGILDPRPFYDYNPGQNFGSATAGFFTASDILSLNITPTAIGAGAVVAAAHTVTGTPMTLVSATGAGVTAGASVVNANTGITVTGLACIDVPSARVSFGQAATIQLWDPTTLTARALSITANNASGVGGNFTIAGYDIYGFPMSEVLTSAPGSALTVTGKKAWKFVASVTPNFTDGTYTYAVNTTDIFGFPIASTYFGDLTIVYPGSGATNFVTSVTGYTAAVTTVATSTTGDVRGTYALQSASNGTNRLMVSQQLLLPNIALANGPGGTSVTGLFGVNQA